MNQFGTILILAGGDSDRFWPFRKKALVPFLGKYLLTHQIESLLPFAKQLIVVTSSSNHKEISNIINQNHYPFVHLIVQNSNLAGQAAAIDSAKNILKGEVLVVNANDVFDYDFLNSYAKQIRKTNYDFTCVAIKTKNYFPGGYLILKNNELKGIVEKPDPGKQPSEFVKLVVDYFKDSTGLINSLKTVNANQDDIYEHAINALIESKLKSGYVVYEND